MIECDRTPPAPVTVTLKEPSGDELVVETVRTDIVDDPDERLIRFGVNETVSPVGAIAVRETVPVKLLKLVRLRLDEAEADSGIVRLEGFAERKKSETEGPITDTVVVRVFVSFPL